MLTSAPTTAMCILHSFYIYPETFSGFITSEFLDLKEVMQLLPWFLPSPYLLE